LSGCHYYIRDYQGSNRMVVNADGTVEQVTHYYPYGGVIGGIDRNASLQAYKFEGKELDRTYGLDWYDIHARQYDPVVPSWHTMDPLCEKYYNISPYAYCAGNPVNAVDVDGMYISFSPRKDVSYIYRRGNFYENKWKDVLGVKLLVGRIINPKRNGNMQRTLLALRKMENSKDPTVHKVFKTLSNLNSGVEHRISITNKKSKTVPNGCLGDSNIMLNYDDVDNSYKYGDFEGIGLTDYELVGHELKHAYDYQFFKPEKGVDENTGIDVSEYEAVNFENLIRTEEDRPQRMKYTKEIPDEYKG